VLLLVDVPVDGDRVSVVVEPDVGLGGVVPFPSLIMVNVGLALPESPITDKANGEDQSEKERSHILTNDNVIGSGGDVRDDDINASLSDVEALSKWIIQHEIQTSST